MVTRTHPDPVMGITTYDRWSALMMAVTFGLLVCVLAVATWSPEQARPTSDPSPPVEFVGLDDAGEPAAPPIEQAVESPAVELPHALLRETSEVALHEVLVDVSELTAESLLQQSEPADGTTGIGPGGDGYLPIGDPGLGGRGQRWFVRYGASESIDEYARQLSQLGIELAAVLADGTIAYFSAPASIRRATEPDERLGFVWGNDDRAAVDRQLFTRAGIDASQATIVHFYSAETEAEMAELEKEYANRAVDDIRRSYFGIVEGANGPEFRVLRQTYHR